MWNGIKKIFVFLVVLLIRDPAFSLEFSFYGARSIGMGGTGVGIVSDGTAVYWNPAALGFMNKFGLDINGGAGASLYGNIIKDVQDLMESDYFTIIRQAREKDELDNNDIFAMINLGSKILDIMGKEVGFGIKGSGGLTLRVSRYGGGAFAFYDAGIYPVIDDKNLGSLAPEGVNPVEKLAGNGGDMKGYFTDEQRGKLITDIEKLGGDWARINPSTGNTYAVDYINRIETSFLNKDPSLRATDLTVSTTYTVAKGTQLFNDFAANNTSVRVRGLILSEFVPFSMGYKISENLSIGGSFKILVGNAFDSTRLAFAIENGETNYINGNEMIDMLISSGKTSTNIGLDLAFLFRTKRVSLGLLLRNINFPSFKTNEGTTLRANMQTRAGVGFKPLSVTLTSSRIRQFFLIVISQCCFLLVQSLIYLRLYL